MKKILSLLCLVMVLGLPATLKAEMKPSVTFYGNLRYSLSYTDWGTTATDEGFRADDNASRFGIKASHGNEDGRAFIHMQAGMPSVDGGEAFKKRFFFGGFECDYGTLTYGTMSNAYKMPGVKLDPFYDTPTISSLGEFGESGATYGLSDATNGFQNNTLQYVTPSFSGLKLVGSVSFTDNDLDNQLAWLGGASYTTNGLTVGAVYADNPEFDDVWAKLDKNTEAIRAYASYKGDGWKAGASYENIDNGVDVNYFYLTGTAMLKEAKTDLSLSLGVVDDGDAEGLGINAGVTHHLLDNTKIYAQASYADLEMESDNPYIVAVGAVYSFKYTAK